jgi:hypothetical protein
VSEQNAPRLSANGFLNEVHAERQLGVAFIKKACVHRSRRTLPSVRSVQPGQPDKQEDAVHQTESSRQPRIRDMATWGWDHKPPWKGEWDLEHVVQAIKIVSGKRPQSDGQRQENE